MDTVKAILAFPASSAFSSMKPRPRDRGETRKDSQRYRECKAVAKLLAAALGDPPAEWTEQAEKGNGRCHALLRIWSRIVAQDVLRVLNCSHWMLLMNTCQLQWKVDEACRGYGKATSGDYSTLKAHYAALGMPIDSSKVAEAVRSGELSCLELDGAS
jgi:hypothetical protein